LVTIFILTKPREKDKKEKELEREKEERREEKRKKKVQKTPQKIGEMVGDQTSKPGSKSLKEGKKNHQFWNSRIAVLVVLTLLLEHPDMSVCVS
jgi:hypothetical protein